MISMKSTYCFSPLVRVRARYASLFSERGVAVADCCVHRAVGCCTVLLIVGKGMCINIILGSLV